jgi:hypothetical protein
VLCGAVWVGRVGLLVLVGLVWEEEDEARHRTSCLQCEMGASFILKLQSKHLRNAGCHLCNNVRDPSL